MPLRLAKASVAAAVLAIALAGCTSSTSLVSKRTQGYEIPASALQQIRPGQSQQLVQMVLGSPQSTNTFGDQTAWYYVETKVNQTAFGLTMIQERTVLAVYFDKNKKVTERAVYSLEDGRPINVETRRTPSFGQDKTFIESILESF
ncbi:outer membrane protein assembly factor BamE [Devosia sp. YIM 151766]|uniref:outer membrane protein assembly factor BamE n=1 Tax=Devosia sp. YIM 151766 TaxID=3017325 RepID=UPI00255C2EFB|nr:outer membrane protein assembly factor BamE [Devosia sp. YIM 151766]WIY53998.1 outer membrane protein assembly factor BamE [Devosia sp. YIM 151766]